MTNRTLLVLSVSAIALGGPEAALGQADARPTPVALAAATAAPSEPFTRITRVRRHPYPVRDRR